MEVSETGGDLLCEGSQVLVTGTGSAASRENACWSATLHKGRRELLTSTLPNMDVFAF